MEIPWKEKKSPHLPVHTLGAGGAKFIPRMCGLTYARVPAPIKTVSPVSGIDAATQR